MAVFLLVLNRIWRTRLFLADRAVLTPSAASGLHSWEMPHTNLEGFGWGIATPDARQCIMLSQQPADSVDSAVCAAITGTGQKYGVASASLSCDTSSDAFWQQSAHGGKMLVYAGRYGT